MAEVPTDPNRTTEQLIESANICLQDVFYALKDSAEAFAKVCACQFGNNDPVCPFWPVRSILIQTYHSLNDAKIRGQRNAQQQKKG